MREIFFFYLFFFIDGLEPRSFSQIIFLHGIDHEGVRAAVEEAAEERRKARQWRGAGGGHLMFLRGTEKEQLI